MSVRSVKKLQKNSQSILNNDKKGSSEDKNHSSKNSEKKFQKEDEKEKKKIDWEEEKDVLEKYLNEKYPLSKQKVRRIIEERADRYIDMDKYKTFFFNYQSEKLTDNIKKSKKLSNAPDDVKSFFDTEAKESVDYCSSEDDDDDENDNIDDDNESKETNSDVEEVDHSSLRKRKCESSTLDEATPKKKDTSILRWLPNGDKVSYFISVK